jgi:putative oxidoreductase
MSQSSRNLSARCARAADGLRSPVLLFIRLTWGYQLAESGWGHLTHVAKTVQFFESLHIPFATANVYLSGATELVGGSLLILGLFARLVSIPVFFNFGVAYLTASLPDLIKSWHDKGAGDTFDAFINDSAFPFLVMSLVILAFGPGRIALDALWARRSSA